MMKYSIFFLTLLMFIGCSSPIISLTNNTLKIQNPSDEKQPSMVLLKNSTIDYSLAHCAMNSYTLEHDSKEYRKIYAEAIILDSNCQWNGSALGFFKSLLQEQNKFKSIHILKEIEKENFIFTQFYIDERYLLNLVTYWDTSSFSFFIDPYGDLTTALEEKMKIRLKFKNISDPLKLDSSPSLAKENILNNYFSRESKTPMIILRF